MANAMYRNVRAIPTDPREIQRIADEEVLPALLQRLFTLPLDIDLAAQARLQGDDTLLELLVTPALDAVSGRGLGEVLVNVLIDRRASRSPWLFTRGSASYAMPRRPPLVAEHNPRKVRAARRITVYLSGKHTPRQLIETLGGELQDAQAGKTMWWSSTAEPRTHLGKLYSLLLHEFTHLQDYPRGQAKAAEYELHQAAYYNDPREVRAYMQQVVDEGLRWAPSVRDDHASDAAFVMAVAGASPTWQRIAPYLQESNQQLVLKALVRALQERALIA